MFKISYDFLVISLLTADLSHCKHIYYIFVDTVKHVFYVLTIFTVPVIKNFFLCVYCLHMIVFSPGNKASFFSALQDLPRCEEMEFILTKSEVRQCRQFTVVFIYLLAMQRGKCAVGTGQDPR